MWHDSLQALEMEVNLLQVVDLHDTAYMVLAALSAMDTSMCGASYGDLRLGSPGVGR